MINRASVGLVLVLGVAACSGAPTQATPIMTLSASVATLALERTTAATVQVTLVRGGTPSDVTAAAIWTTSNPAVATVAAGVVTAVGPGSATIAAAHEGRSVSVPVTVRRRVYLRGRILTRDAVSRGSVSQASVYINGQRVSQNDLSGPASSMSVSFGLSQLSGLPQAPGDHAVAVQLDNLPGQFTFEYESPVGGVEVRDKDTGELVTTIGVPGRTETLPANARVTWTITIGSYIS